MLSFLLSAGEEGPEHRNQNQGDYEAHDYQHNFISPPNIYSKLTKAKDNIIPDPGWLFTINYNYIYSDCFTWVTWVASTAPTKNATC